MVDAIFPSSLIVLLRFRDTQTVELLELLGLPYNLEHGAAGAPGQRPAGGGQQQQGTGQSHRGGYRLFAGLPRFPAKAVWSASQEGNWPRCTLWVRWRNTGSPADSCVDMQHATNGAACPSLASVD